MKWPDSASLIWYCGLGAALLALAANYTGKVFPADWKETINFLSGVVAVVSAWLAKSPAKEPPREVWTPTQRAANIVVDKMKEG